MVASGRTLALRASSGHERHASKGRAKFRENFDCSAKMHHLEGLETNMSQKKHDFRTVIRVAAQAGVSPRTAAKHLSGAALERSSLARDAVVKAARELGVEVHGAPNEVRR
jgi:hypothetical protein